VTQYSRDVSDKPRGRGVLDTPLSRGMTAWGGREITAYLPNNRSTSQPSNPAAASGRADGLGGGADVRAGGGRYPPPCGAGADGWGAALTCDAVWNRFDMKPPRCEFGRLATGTP
jgi:hypothetical protein